MRLFFAVEADAPVRESAQALILRLQGAGADLRWVAPRDMHVTLRFVGPAPEGSARCEELLAEAAAGFPPFEMVFGAPGLFEGEGRPAVAWLGLARGAEELSRLAGLLGRDEPRPYAPHLTVGRGRRPGPAPALAAALSREEPLGLRRPVEEICLYASRPAPFGHAYEILRRAPLRGR